MKDRISMPCKKRRKQYCKKYALDKITGEFTRRGYKTRNFVSMLQNSKKDELLRTKSQSDVNTQIVQQLPGDIVITVGADVTTDDQNQVECQLSITAVENQTNGNLAAATFPSGKYYKGVGEAELVDYALKKIKSDFLIKSALRSKQWLLMVVRFM